MYRIVDQAKSPSGEFKTVVSVCEKKCVREKEKWLIPFKLFHFLKTCKTNIKFILLTVLRALKEMHIASLPNFQGKFLLPF